VTRAFALFVVVLSLVASCGGGDSPAGSPTGEGGAPAPETGRAITANDSGETFTLAPGAETSLRLSSEYVWEEPALDGDAVELSPVDYIQDPGFSEWLVRGARPGTVTISSLCEPACDGEHGCPDEAVRFQVTITVAG
jgi:hypothetical protein